MASKKRTRETNTLLLIILACFVPFTGGIVYWYHKKSIVWIVLFTILPWLSGIITLVLWLIEIFPKKFH